MTTDTDHFMISGQILALVAFCLFTVLGCLSPTQAWADSVLPPGGTSSSTGNCDDPCDENCPGSLAAQTRDAADSYTTGAMVASQKQFRSTQFKDGAACMMKLMTYFDSIGKILSGTISLIGAILIGLITEILTRICDFIVTGINNLLASICIPVPNLAFSLSLPQLQAGSCDGISLMNFISVRGSPSGLPPIGFGGYSIPAMALGTDVNNNPQQPE